MELVGFTVDVFKIARVLRYQVAAYMIKKMTLMISYPLLLSLKNQAQ